MIVLWVGIAVLAFAVVLLGAVGYVLQGAFQRLRSEVAGLERELQPVLAEVRDSAVRIAQGAERRREDPQQID